MLEPPALAEEKILAALERDYGLRVDRLTFLPLGADAHTAVYSVVARDATPYFLKLRGGRFDAASVLVPRYLKDQGIAQIMAPLETQTGRLWSSLDGFKSILYPFLAGQNGYEVSLTPRQWGELGAALNKVHASEVPPALRAAVRQEAYAADWRLGLERYLDQIERSVYQDVIAKELAGYLKAHRAQVFDLIRRAGRLAEALRAGSQEPVLCHSDLHAGNLLIEAGGAFYIVDWDEPILAPKERDLMFVGGGLMGGWRTPSEEEALFYEGYGPTRMDTVAMAYYRYERIVVDLAEFCHQIFSAEGGVEDREQSLRYVRSNFRPGGTIEVAHRSDRSGLA